jgi:Dolichyl-phosphate-mannose-protein mannosyltransferase
MGCSVVIVGCVRHHARAAEFALVVALVAASVAILGRASLRHSFEHDESRWIAGSRYFWTTLVEGDPFGAAWQPNYVVLTHPPVARYVMGVGLWLQGWTPDRLNGRYDRARSPAFNERAGNLPSPELLAAARRVELVMAVGSVVLLYLIGRVLAGPPAGVVAVLLALGNPLLSKLWTRALAEAPLTSFSLLALLLALRGVARLPTGGVGPGWPIAGGVVLGLAAATKLTGILFGAGLALFAVLQQASEWWRHRRLAGLGAWLALALAAVLAFIAVNPLLYPNPIARTAMMFEHRREEMRAQQRAFPRQAVPDDIRIRSRLVGQRVFLDWSSFRGSRWVVVDALLVASGILVGLVATGRDLAARRPLGPLAFLLCWALATYAGVTINIGYDSMHYYGPLVTANTLLSGVAVSAALSWLAGRLRRARWTTSFSGRGAVLAGGNGAATGPFGHRFPWTPSVMGLRTRARPGRARPSSPSV